MAKLTIFRGLPGSGKTTEARRRVDGAEPGTLVRLNRDDLRRSMLARGYSKPVHAAEQRITAARDAALAALLSAGVDVICDDTNLRAEYVRSLMEIARKAGASVEVVDFLDVPLDECVRRDAARPEREQVGWQVIHDMFSRYIAALNGGPMPIPELTTDPPLRVELYVATPGTPRAVLVDVDGTVALLNGRNPYDETLVSADLPNTPVIDTLHALVDAGYWPIFMSGRSEGCREATAEWLTKHLGYRFGSAYDGQLELHMRAADDGRPDHVVKLELFDRHVRRRYDVRVVLDDRDSVVALWRSLGMTCLQVAPGAF